MKAFKTTLITSIGAFLIGTASPAPQLALSTINGRRVLGYEYQNGAKLDMRPVKAMALPTSSMAPGI